MRISYSEEELDRVHELKEALFREVHDLVDAKLKDETEAVADLVRTQMSETFRFWPREGVQR